MFNSQLFFFVAIILISDDAQVQSTTSLSSANNSWKREANQALGLIRTALVMLKSVPGKPGRRSLVQAQNWTVTALSKKVQTDILLMLKKALRVDFIAFTKLNSGCIKGHVSTTDILACKTIGVLIKLSIRDLIEAILEAETDETKKTTIKGFYSNSFAQNSLNRTKIPPDINATLERLVNHTEMFTSQLFFFVAVILISEDSQAQQPTSLPYADDSWQTDANNALDLIQSAFEMVKGKSGRKSLERVETLIVAVLRKENRIQILYGLKKVLRADYKASNAVNRRCVKKHHKRSDVIACKAAGALIKLSIREIIAAILKVVTDESKKTQIEVLFRENFQNGTKIPNFINATVIGVLNVMDY